MLHTTLERWTKSGRGRMISRFLPPLMRYNRMKSIIRESNFFKLEMFLYFPNFRIGSYEQRTIIRFSMR